MLNAHTLLILLDFEVASRLDIPLICFIFLKKITGELVVSTSIFILFSTRDSGVLCNMGFISPAILASTVLWFISV